MTAAPLALPAFYSPFPLEVHPDHDEVDARTVEWMDEHGLYCDQNQRLRLARTGCGGLAAHMAASGPRDRLQILADFTTWAFAFDDEYCDEGPLRNLPGELADAVARMHRAIESPERPIDESDRYAMALRDIRRRLDEHATPDEAEGFVEWMRSYFLIEVQKAGNTSRGVRPNLSDYTVARMYSGGGMVFVRMPAVVAGIDVPPVLTDRRVRALTEMTATITNWDTDFFSFPKERERTGDGYNLIDAVITEYGCAEAEAITRAMAIRDRVMCLYLRLRAAVAADASRELARYLDTLDRYMRGVLEWIHHTNRYVHLDGLEGACPFEPGGMTDVPSDDSRSAPEIPAIAWWWEYDPEGRRR